MNRTLFFLSIVIFSVFLGSQITEGVLLIPYWKTLPRAEFYAYYAKFGPTIGKFYTVLTIVAAVVPFGISIYCFLNKLNGLKYALVSSFFAFLVIAFFYVYFKGANQQFYEAALNANQLKAELKTWEYLHWLRVLLETLSLAFLILSLDMISQKKRRA